MPSLFRDRALLVSVFVVFTASSYVACGSETTPVVPTGCANEGDCYLDHFPEGTSCLGGYCIPPGVERECTTDRQCRSAGFPEGTTCRAGQCQPPPVDAAMERPDAEGVDASAAPIDAALSFDAAASDDVVSTPVDAFAAEDDAPTSGAL
ncbi:MAG: hypothetical protein U0353_35045 [Sandaracinus sp.]